MTNDGGRPVRVLVVDDDPLLRSGLRTMLSGHADLELVGEAADGRAALGVVDEVRPDVVLMDIRMPRLDGIAATRALMAQPYPPRVVVLTTFDADELVLEAIAVGADGFLLKDTPPEEIVEAVRRVAAGEPILSASATRSLLGRLRAEQPPARQERAERLLATLSERELEVAVAIGRGLSNAEIAEELHLEVTTVKGYAREVFAKLDVTNRTQVAITVHDAGLA
jgi:DNA-binding NarL/FixJ family response regulator